MLNTFFYTSSCSGIKNRWLIWRKRGRSDWQRPGKKTRYDESIRFCQTRSITNCIKSRKLEWIGHMLQHSVGFIDAVEEYS